MPQTHVAVIAITGRSHLLPSLPMVRELVRRGHDVTLAVGEDLADLAGASGADVLAYPSLLPREDDPATAWPPSTAARAALLLEEGVAALPTLLDRFGQNRPNVVLHDVSALAGPVLAGALGVTAVQLLPMFAPWRGFEEELAEQIDPIKADPVYQDYDRRHTAWLRQYGVPGTPTEVGTYPKHGIVLIPKILQPNADRVAPAYRFVGPCIDEERARRDGWQAPAGAGPLLYVAFGTAYNDQLEVYRTVIDAFAGSGWRVAMAVGRYVDPAALGDLPEGIAVHRWVPQLVALAEATVFLSHAGMGSAVEALWFGVPVVAVPQDVDQPLNAERLVELGIGRYLHREDVTPSLLRDAVESLTDPAVQARSAQLREEVRSTGGPAAAADAVEELLT